MNPDNRAYSPAELDAHERQFIDNLVTLGAEFEYDADNIKRSERHGKPRQIALRFTFTGQQMLPGVTFGTAANLTVEPELAPEPQA